MSFLSKPASQPDVARQWAVDTAKEIFRFIHEKSRLREELEKHNKDLLLTAVSCGHHFWVEQIRGFHFEGNEMPTTLAN